MPPIEGGADAGLDGSVLDAACGLKCGVYVSNAGNDNNSGLPDAPVKTLVHAINVAHNAGAPSIFIAAGQYTETVKLSDGISLLGGYQCDHLPCDWTSRDLARDTAIIDQDFTGVLADSTITRATTLEGLRIQGHPGSLSGTLATTIGAGAVALTLAGGAPTILSCQIEGATVTDGTGLQRRSIGVLVSGPSNNTQGPMIKGCTIGAGQAADSSIGVLIEDKTGSAVASDASVDLVQNTIKAGTAAFSAGVQASASGSATLLDSNVIEAGPSTGTPAANGGTNVGSWGIAVSSAMAIHANYINASNAKSTSVLCPSTIQGFCGGIASSSATLTITSNVIGGVGTVRSCAVSLVSSDRPPGKVVIDSNTLDPGGVGAGTTVSAAIVLRNSGTTDVTAYATVRNNILLGGVNKSRWGVYEDVGTKPVHLGVLDDNDFFNPPPANSTTDFAYRSWDPTSGNKDYTFDNLSTIPAPVPDGNINKDPGFDPSTAAKPYHLKQGSPCIDKGTLTPTQTPTTDIDGDPRPTPNTLPDIGADETNFGP